MRTWLGDVEQPLAQLVLLENHTQLLVRSEHGLAEPTGQRVLDFIDEAPKPNVKLPEGPTTADAWFDLASGFEDAGQLPKAIDAYRQALLMGGPDCILCFNLGNALYATGQKEQAVERWYQVVELDRQFVDAWNNLGTALEELGQLERALAAYYQAVESSPDYADAHFNLADLLEKIGRPAEAKPHWEAYLHDDSQSQWGQYAQTRLTAIGS